MPKLSKDEAQLIDLSNVNPNKMLEMSLNFELLKYVITSLIHNQQNMGKQLSNLKLSSLKQKKHSLELELSITDMSLQKDLSPKEKEELLNQKEELKSKIDNIKKEIESLTNENEEEQNKRKIPIYNIDKANMDEGNDEFNEEEKNIDIEQKDKNETVKEKIKDKYEKENKKANEKNSDIKKDNEIKNNKEEQEKIKENKTDNEIIDKDKNEIKKEPESSEKEQKGEKEEKEKAQVNQPPVPKGADAKNDEKEKEKNKYEDLHKQLQLIVGELKNVKSKQQTLDKDFSLFKQNVTEKIKSKLENDIPSMLDNAFEKKMSLIQKNFNKNVDKINEDINNLNENYDQRITDLNNNILKEISLKEEINNQEFEQIKNRCHSLKENLSITNEKLLNMITNLTFNNLKNELNDKIEGDKKITNLDISILKNSVNALKAQLSEHLDDTRDHDNLILVMKTMETSTANLKKLLEFKKAFEEKDKRKAIVDTHKFVRQEGFNEAISNIHKSIDSNKKEFSEIRLDIDCIRTKDLNIKANLRDLKNLEDTVLTKMETLKELIRDKYVEKTMLVKNLKYLELQTKQLIEETKKNEKQENWLLAKKPFNGHLCASCEAYLGDLKPNTNSKYVAWNKYPIKDPIDKVFRINAGFSKVLQMVHNHDNNNERAKSNSLNNSKEERNNSSAELERKNHNYKSGRNSQGKDNNRNHNNSSAQLDDSEMGGTLPRISVKKTNNMSSVNVFSEETNKSSITNSNIGSKIGQNNKSYNISKISSNAAFRKSRSLVDDFDTNIKSNNELNTNEDNKEVQKPKITKVYKKKGDSSDKNGDNNDNK